MKLMLLATLLAVALARVPSSSWEEEHFQNYQIKEKSFQPEREYIFQYNGQVATGLPGVSSQHSVTQVQAKVSLVFKNSDDVVMSIRKIRVGKLNEEIYNPRAMIPFMSFQPVELKSSQEKLLSLPIQFSYRQGYVSDLEMDSQEESWSANIKRGILNMLQVNLQKRNQVQQQRLPESSYPQSQKFQFFSTIEETLEGKCKTHYTVVSNPSRYWQSSPVLNVTRSIDYEECEQRPEMKYNFRFQDPCKRCNERLYQDDEKFLRSSSVAKFNISGTMTDFLIESAIVESQYQVVPFNQQGNLITTYINQTLVLRYSGPIQKPQQVRVPRNPVKSTSDLVYTLDWDVQKEQFFMGQQEENPFYLESTPENLKQILRPLIHKMRDEVDESVPMMYLRLVRFLAFSEKSELKKLFQQYVHQLPSGFDQEEHEKIKSILIDALADAGTKHTVSYLLELIQQENVISPLRASIVIKQLINVRLPSKEMIKEYSQFLKSPVVKENWILKQSAYLTLGSLIQGLCMPSEDRLALLPRGSNVYPNRYQPNNQICPEVIQEKIPQALFNELEQSQSYEDQILIIKTLGNMGLPTVLPKLEKIIMNENKYSMMVRIEAVLALRQLRELMPQRVISILMPIFMNQQATNELRMASVYQIFQTMPSRPILDQISRKLFTERSQQVASFVYSYMYTVANTTNPCEKSFARDLSLSLRHGRKIAGAFLPQYSKYLHTTFYSQKMLMGVDMNLASIVNNRTFVPRAIVFNVHSRFLGFWSKYLLTVGFAQENVESLLSQYLRRTEFSDISINDILTRSPRSQTSPMKELKQLWKQLETVARELPNVTPKGMMFLKLKDQEFFMLPISQKSIQSLPSLREIRRTFVQGQHFYFHKAAVLHNLVYKIPTAIGMPLRIAIFIPTMTQFSGKIRVDTQNPFKLMLQNLKPSFAATFVSRVEVWNPFATNGIQIKANAKFNLPVNAKITVDIKNRMPSIKFSVEPPKKPVEWVRFETVPTTYHKLNVLSQKLPYKSEHKTIISQQWNRVYNVREFSIVRKAEEYIQKILGVEVQVDGLWHHTQMSAPLYIPVCPLSGPNHFVLRSRPSQQQPKEIVLRMAVQSLKSLQQNIRPEKIQFTWEEEQFTSQQIKPLKGFNTILKTEIYTKGAEPKDRRAELQTELMCSPYLRVCKMENTLEIQPIPQLTRNTFQVCVKAESQLPSPARQYEELFKQQVFAQMKTTWGFQECRPQNVVELKLNAQHSQEQREYYQNSQQNQWFTPQRCQEEPSLCSPYEMDEQLREPQYLLKYNLWARYENVPFVLKNYTNKAFQLLKAYYYLDVDSMNFHVRNPSQQIFAQLTLDTKTRQFFNATIRTPIENVTVTDAQLPVPIFYPVHTRRPAYQISKLGDIFENLIQPVVQQCYASERLIQTFDEVKYKLPLSTCWSLLTKDCEDSQNPSYAVLIRKLNQNSKQKEVKIITYRHKILLTPKNQQIIVKVDGKQLPVEEYPYTQHLRIESYSPEEVIVSLPETGIKVHFDKYTSKIQMSPVMQSIQCGLCGQYNHEQDDEFTTPQNTKVYSPLESFKEYTIKSSQCQLPKYQEMDEDDFTFTSQWENSQEEIPNLWEGQQQSSSEEEYKRVNTIQRIYTEENSNYICFSLNTIKKCPRQAYPSQYESEVEQVSLRCIPRSHEDAHRFLRIARYERFVPQEMIQTLKQESEKTIEAEIQVPSECSLHF